MRKIALVMVLSLSVVLLSATPSLAPPVRGECSDYDDGDILRPFADCRVHLTCVWQTACSLQAFGEAEAAGLVFGKLIIYQIEGDTYQRYEYSCGPGVVRCQIYEELVVPHAAEIDVFCEAYGYMSAGAAGVRLDPTIGLIPSVYCSAGLTPA